MPTCKHAENGAGYICDEVQIVIGLGTNKSACNNDHRDGSRNCHHDQAEQYLASSPRALAIKGDSMRL